MIVAVVSFEMAEVEEAPQVGNKEAAPANVVEEPLDLVRLSLDERIYVKVYSMNEAPLGVKTVSRFSDISNTPSFYDSFFPSNSPFPFFFPNISPTFFPSFMHPLVELIHLLNINIFSLT